MEEAPNQMSEVAACPPAPPAVRAALLQQALQVGDQCCSCFQSPDTAVRGHARTRSLATNPHSSHEGFFGQPGDHKAGPRGTAGRGAART